MRGSSWPQLHEGDHSQFLSRLNRRPRIRRHFQGLALRWFGKEVFDLPCASEDRDAAQRTGFRVLNEGIALFRHLAADGLHLGGNNREPQAPLAEKNLRSLPLATSHKTTLPGLLADATVLPSGLNATERTGPMSTIGAAGCG